MKRVLIVGCPGSGKSTLARALRDRTGLPLYYLDQIWHRPDGTHISPEAFDARLFLYPFAGTVDFRRQLPAYVASNGCSVVIRCFGWITSCAVCLEGAAARIGKPREDMPWVEKEFDPEFRQWIEDFAKDQRPTLEKLLQAVRGDKQVVIFHTRAEADDYLQHRGDKAPNGIMGDLINSVFTNLHGPR